MGWGHSGKCEKNCSCDVARAGKPYKEVEMLFKCECGLYTGRKHGLLIHKRMMHKK